MKQYLLSIYQPEGPLPSPERLENVMLEIGAIRAELQAEGAWVFGDGLHAPSAATVLRPQGEEIVMIDGPFVEGKEHIGGIVVIRVPDLDAALEWGRRYADATRLPIEVRPFQGEQEG
jgi:hypothetical protein